MKRYLNAFTGLSILVTGCAGPQSNVRPATTVSFGHAPAERAFEEGKARLAEGHSGLAIVAFENALANNPQSVAALNGLGAAYDDLHRYDLAQSYYRRALALEPKNADVAHNMAISSKLAGKSDGPGWLARTIGLVQTAPDPKSDTTSTRLASQGAAQVAGQAEAYDVEKTRPKIQRASVLEYELVLPEQRPLDLGRATPPGSVVSLVNVRTRLVVPPLEEVIQKPTQPATATVAAKVTSFDPSLLACAPNVAPGTLNAIIHTESRGNPLALHVNGADAQPPPARDAAEAARIATSYVERGYSVDVGLMQVNSRNLAVTGHTIQQALDPCTNIMHGSTILTNNFTSAARTRDNEADALLAAISAYNTGDFRRGFANGYVANVISSVGAAGPRLQRSPAAIGPLIRPMTGAGKQNADKARLSLAIDLIEHRLLTAKLNGLDTSIERLAMR